MINFKCRNCGGEMTVSQTGEMVCSYCGGHFVFSDKDLSEYKEFRYRMLAYLSALSDSPDTKETENIWRRAEQKDFALEDGRNLTVSYLFKGEQDGVTVYTARRNVLFFFSEAEERVSRFYRMSEKLIYPSADIKDLSKFFPQISGKFRLADGRIVVAVSKDEELFPLSAFGSLPPEHAAWIVSRLENICCVLEYSDIEHNGIDLESVFINARTHQAYLLGGWWNASPHEGGSQNDLFAIRAVARRITGVGYDRSPEQFKRFVNGTPAGDAYEDFALWDKVIEEGFHGRKFRKLDLSTLGF